MFTETKTMPSRYLYEAVLSNGTTIFVRSGGVADGDDGKTYREITHKNSEGDLISDGWVIEET